jgi:cytochrome c-type protein NapC
MTEKSPGESAPKTSKSLFGWLKRPPQCSMARMLVIGILGGIIIWGGLNTGMEYTNRTEFCLSCHTMKTPYEELKKTVHYSNRTGTSVGCADCHVASSKEPLDYARKMTQKVFASKDVIGEILGTIDTPEKFEAHRLTMAKRVWAQMEASDSKECRNCHKFEKMDSTKQKDRSVVKHEGAMQDGKTCIACHKGIAHKPVHHLLEGGQAPAAAPASASPPPARTPEAPKAEAAPAQTAAQTGATAASAAAPAPTTVAAVPEQPAKATPKTVNVGCRRPSAHRCRRGTGSAGQGNLQVRSDRCCCAGRRQRCCRYRLEQGADTPDQGLLSWPGRPGVGDEQGRSFLRCGHH